MSGEKEESLEFEESGLAKLQKQLAASLPRDMKNEEIVRHSFRAPCIEEDEAEVVIKGKRYPVANVGSQGLGLLLPQTHDLQMGEVLSSITFRIRGKELKLQGRVVHISIEEDHLYLCGIALMEMTEEQSKMIRELIHSCRQALFIPEEKE